MDLQLKDKVIIVTGGARGIGEGITEVLAHEGAILPPVMGLIADSVGIQQSFILPALCFIAVAIYGLGGYASKPVRV